jgi:hypothetical protein
MGEVIELRRNIEFRRVSERRLQRGHKVEDHLPKLAPMNPIFVASAGMWIAFAASVAAMLLTDKA